MDDGIWLLCGLGNPGPRYERTRHNLGWMAVDSIAGSDGNWREDCRSLVAKGRVANFPAVFAKPLTYMNLSGDAVQALMARYRIKPDHVLVFCDDIQFDVGKVRVRRSGSHGGQNGLRSIIGAIGEGFPRVRIGAGKPPPERDMADWVLSRFSDEERRQLDSVLERMPELAKILISQGVDACMQRFNG